MNKKLTNAELMLLGLVAEMPRHGYQIEQVIEQRGMREWAQIGFSSIYFVLGKLEKAGFVEANTPEGKKAKKVFSSTKAGRMALARQSIDALKNPQPAHSSVLLGIAHWPVLEQATALSALGTRAIALDIEIERLGTVQKLQHPLPDFVEAMFDFSLSQLKAEKQWAIRTIKKLERSQYGKN